MTKLEREIKNLVPFPYKGRKNESHLLALYLKGERLERWQKDIVNYLMIRAEMFAHEKCCAYCGKELEFDQTTIDHKMPRSRGGTDDMENLTICCSICNSRKGSQTPEEFAANGFDILKREKPIKFNPRKTCPNYINFQIIYFSRSPLC